MTPEARAAAQDLLDPAPDPKHRTLAHASTWPDRIKSPKHTQFRQYAFARKLHYVNSPPDANGYGRGRDCPEGKCVIEAIHTYRTLLRDAMDPKMRLVALKFLAHFVGDIHQPLHVGYKRDRGGNDMAVQFFNQKTNLHKTWDTLILRRDNRGMTIKTSPASSHPPNLTAAVGPCSSNTSTRPTHCARYNRKLCMTE
jgi:hypothetical protein